LCQKKEETNQEKRSQHRGRGGGLGKESRKLEGGQKGKVGNMCPGVKKYGTWVENGGHARKGLVTNEHVTWGDGSRGGTVNPANQKKTESLRSNKLVE